MYDKTVTQSYSREEYNVFYYSLKCAILEFIAQIVFIVGELS